MQHNSSGQVMLFFYVFMRKRENAPTVTAMRPSLFTPSYCCIMAANFLQNFGLWQLVPVLPFYLRERYGLADGTIGLVLACYIVSSLMMRPFSGYILDTFPRKPLYILSYISFTCIFLGYMAGGALAFFIILRVLHGLAFGTLSVGGNTIVIDIMPASRRGEGLGYYGLTNNLAMSTGPMAGLLLHGHVTYEMIFAISLAACVAGLLLACRVKTPYKPRAKRPPVSPDRILLLKGIPAGLSLVLLSIPYGATTNYVALYVEEMGLHVQSGLYFVLMATGMGISRIFSGKRVDKGYVTECIHHGFFLVILAFALLGSCESMMRRDETVTECVFLLIPFIQGVGFGIMFPAYNTLFINLAPNSQRATATGTYLTSWDVGLGLGMILSGIVAQWSDFQTVYVGGAILGIVSMLHFDRLVTPHYRKNRLR